LLVSLLKRGMHDNGKSDETVETVKTSSIVAFKGAIEDSIDLAEPYRTVTQRYYTRFFKIDENRVQRNDLCLLVHSNRISIVCLAPSHPLITKVVNITAVNCEISAKVDRKSNKAVGKSKKGGQNLDSNSILCYLETDDCKYPISAISPAKLICMNKAVLADPNLARLKPDADGHIAILLPHLGQIEGCKKGLMTQDEYEAFIKKESDETL